MKNTLVNTSGTPVENKIELTFNTPLLQVVFRLVVDVRIIQHGLRRNAPDVQASSTERTSLLDTRRLHGEKRRMRNGANAKTIYSPSDRAEQP